MKPRVLSWPWVIGTMLLVAITCFVIGSRRLALHSHISLRQDAEGEGAPMDPGPTLSVQAPATRLYTDEQIADMTLKEVRQAIAEVKKARDRAVRERGPSEYGLYREDDVRLVDRFLEVSDAEAIAQEHAAQSAGVPALLYSSEQIGSMTLQDAQEALAKVAWTRTHRPGNAERSARLKIEFDSLMQRVRLLRGPSPSPSGE